MKTILAAIDFSTVSRRVVAEAVRLARALRGRVVILHAVTPPVIMTDIVPLVGGVMVVAAELERAGNQNLRRLQARLAKRRITVETICQQGHPVAIILDHAARQRADFVVLGSHGHTGLYDLVVGSTANGVLKRAKVPVIVVPAHGAKASRVRRRHTNGTK